MNTHSYKLIGSDQPNLTKDYVQFANINLDKDTLLSHLNPIMEVIRNRIQSTYKNSTQITYTGSRILENNFIDCMQFDDVCLKLIHIESGCLAYITLGSRLARTILIRLLSTSLIDDSSSLPFSATEKGIFSFIIARLIFDAKNILGDKMPNCKLLGIYHFQDEALTAVNTEGFGSYNFSLNFGNKSFPITIAVPSKTFGFFTSKKFISDNLLARSGHLRFPLITVLKIISLNQGALQSLAFGDLIIFDHVEQTLKHKAINGPIRSSWHNIGFSGMLSNIDNRYYFMPDQHHLMEDEIMEQLEISHPSDYEKDNQPTNNQNQLAHLAKNIRVPISIELSRIPMTLKEICAIKEGEIIDLHRKIDDPLDIVVEGKIIGHCQPIQIEGRLGIRVLNMVGDEPEKNS